MIIILMGVSGSGKSVIGKKLAEELRWIYFDGDDFHSKENKEKMGSGIPLTDEDRWPWLETLAKLLREKKEKIIVGCSALKQSYRDILCAKPEVVVVYLKGDFELIKKRMEARKGHYFKADLLASQFADLEEPKDGVVVSINDTIEGIVKQIRIKLKI